MVSNFGLMGRITTSQQTALLLMFSMALFACTEDDTGLYHPVSDSCQHAKSEAALYQTDDRFREVERQCPDAVWVGELHTIYRRQNGSEHDILIPYPAPAFEAGFIDVAPLQRLMHRKTDDDVAEILRDLFGRDELPNDLPTLRAPDVPDSHLYKSFLPDHLKQSVRVDGYWLEQMYPNGNVFVRNWHIVYTPAEPPKRVVILIQGHDNRYLTEQAVYLLERGFAVILRGIVGFVDDYFIAYGGVPFQGVHDDYYFFETDQFDPVVLFLAPQVITVNLAAELFPDAEKYVVGLSGGGFSALLLHAFDRRIDVSASVSGWKPFFLRYAEASYPELSKGFEGDYEQHTARFYARHAIHYLDLVDLATRTGGRHYQVWVEGDTSTFGGQGYLYYARQLSALTRGHYQLILDQESVGHDIETSHLEAIMGLEPVEDYHDYEALLPPIESPIR